MKGNSDVSSAPTFETQTIGGVGSAATAINRIQHLVFGESVGSGSVDLQLVKKVVVTKGPYKDYVNEMQHIWHICHSHSCL